MSNTEELDNSVYDANAEEVYVNSSGKAIDDKQVNVFKEFLKQLKPGLELFRVSVPIFTLQPISLLEKLTTYSRPNELIFQYILFNTFVLVFFFNKDVHNSNSFLNINI